MKKNRRLSVTIICLIVAALAFAGVMFLSSGPAETEDIKSAMKDAVLHDENKVSFLGVIDVNPAFISALAVTLGLLVLMLIIRIFVIPRFKTVPGKLQLLLEQLVGYFDNLSKENSPHKHKFLGAYTFAAGVYIFIGTLFELAGMQWQTVSGASVTLPAPLSDINGAIAMGALSYLVILSGGIAGNGFKGILATLKDFSLPISMSFRLFGALLSGLLVTELVYHYIQLSFILPVIVAVLFTLLHAIIQTYVLTMLTAVYYGEVSEKHKKLKPIQEANHEKNY